MPEGNPGSAAIHSKYLHSNSAGAVFALCAVRVRLTEIGMMQGCSRESVYESIQAVRRKFLKFFSNHPDNGLF